MNINIAFCFNKNLIKQAVVAITSLLIESKDRCNYDIYCVIDNSVSEKDKSLLENIVRTTGSSLTFLYANNDFNKSWTGHYTVAIYYRMMLPKLLPALDYIIYTDVDTVFCSDLVEASMIDLKNNLVAGVRDKVDLYINSGFLIMNLKQMRKEKIYNKWITISQKEQYGMPDQDLLNKTCNGKIMLLPFKYNIIVENLYKLENKSVFSKQELHDLKYHAVMIHYAGTYNGIGRPWDNKKKALADIWWKYAKQTGLF